jgi:acetyl esterase/lipase
VILYFHGGGFFFGGLATHRRFVARPSTAARAPVLSVDYRMVPTVTVSEMIDDCLHAYRHLIDLDYQPSNIVFAGDSAGGYLTFATALRAASEDLPMPGRMVALSPWLDWDVTSYPKGTAIDQIGLHLRRGAPTPVAAPGAASPSFGGHQGIPRHGP